MALIANRASREAARGKWRDVGFRLLDEGVVPLLSADKLAGIAGGSRGPFFNCYRSMADYHADLIELYEQDLLRREREKTYIGDGEALLWALYAASRTLMNRDRAMSRWAASKGKSGADLAYEVVQRKNRRIIDRATKAVTDLGYSGADARAMGKWVSRMFISNPVDDDRAADEVPFDEDEFRSNLEAIVRGAPVQTPGLETIDFGEAGYVVFPTSGKVGKQKLSEAARVFLENLGLPPMQAKDASAVS